MALDPNPYAPPTGSPQPAPAPPAPRPPPPSGPPRARFVIAAGTPRREWSLDVYDDWLRLATADLPAFAFCRADFLACCDVVVGAFIRALAIKAPVRVVLPLSPAALDALRAWLDPVIDAHRTAALARRFALGLPLAGVVVLSSLPIAHTRPDPLGLAWGLALGATSLARRFTSRRELFLADFVVWCLLGCTDVARFARAGGLWNAAFAALAAVFAVGAVKLYSFYGPPQRQRAQT